MPEQPPMSNKRLVAIGEEDVERIRLRCQLTPDDPKWRELLADSYEDGITVEEAEQAVFDIEGSADKLGLLNLGAVRAALLARLRDFTERSPDHAS